MDNMASPGMANVAAPPTVPKQKNPLLAAIGSFFIPGLGQVYNGQGFVKGLLYLIGTLVGSLILVIPGVAIWLFGIYKAYKVAGDINAGIAAYKEASTLNLVIYIVLALVVYGVYFIIIFLLAAVIAAFVYGISSSTSSYDYYSY